MISVWHLLWIIPVCTMFGFLAAVLTIASKED